ncbi:MAG: hypothetical protein ACYDBQ_03045 [Thermoplasmatota archaeon]
MKAQALLGYPARHPGAALADVARAISAPRTMVSCHRRRMAAAGLATVEADRGRTRIFTGASAT